VVRFGARPPAYLVGVLESAIAFRGNKVNLATVARLANRASWLLKLSNEDRSAVENSAAIAVARRRGLIPRAALHKSEDAVSSRGPLHFKLKSQTRDYDLLMRKSKSKPKTAKKSRKRALLARPKAGKVAKKTTARRKACKKGTTLRWGAPPVGTLPPWTIAIVRRRAGVDELAIIVPQACGAVWK
jgi:hypothetical protein